MDVRFCEGRNHRREAQMRAGVLAIAGLARFSEARVRRSLFSLDNLIWSVGPLQWMKIGTTGRIAPRTSEGR